jgi:hypothetical protein
MATQPGTHGFWRGFFTGLLLAAAAGLLLAWAYPPLPLLPPEIDEGTLRAPGAPGLPEGDAGPEPLRAEGVLPAPPPAPLIAEVPTPEAAPEPEESPGGSPSLVPLAPQ